MIFVQTISLPSSKDCTLVLPHKPCSNVTVTVQLCKTNVHYQSCAHSGGPPTPQKNADRSHLTPRLCSWKMSQRSKTKFRFKTVYLLSLWDWKLYPILYVCISIGYMGLQCIYFVHIQYTWCGY
jgi:hypothetical protein